MIAEILLLTTGIYLLCGLVFAIPFVWVGVNRIDPHAARGSWGFRLLIIPGTMFLWPLLARRWALGIREPPEENNPHRCAARKTCSSRREEAHTSARTRAEAVDSKSEIGNRKSEIHRGLVSAAAASGNKGAGP